MFVVCREVNADPTTFWSRVNRLGLKRAKALAIAKGPGTWAECRTHRMKIEPERPRRLPRLLLIILSLSGL